MVVAFLSQTGRTVSIMSGGGPRLSNDQIEQGLGQFFALVAAGHAAACEWLIEVDRGQQFLADGSRSLEDWVSARFGLRRSSAAQLVRVARRLEDLPLTRERFAAGQLSLDQVDALTKIATPETETALVEVASGASNSMLDRLARRADPPTALHEQSVWERRQLLFQDSLDGTETRGRFLLPAGEGRLLYSAVKERADRMPVNPESGRFDPYPARMADGLVELAATVTGTSGEESGPLAQLVVHADLEALTVDTQTVGVAEIEAGGVLASETARRLACDSIVERAVYDDGRRLLGIGRRSRIIPRWLRRQLWHRDGGCRFPGCGTTIFVHGHHIEHWADDGPTDYQNLILLCGYHHRFVHEHGWAVRTGQHGHFEFVKPDGGSYPPSRPALDPRLQALVRT
jgi:hypothetical protein